VLAVAVAVGALAALNAGRALLHPAIPSQPRIVAVVPGTPERALVSRALTPGGQPAGAPAPTHLDIERIRVSAAVVALAPNPDLTVPVPADPAQAGWYAGGPSPGDPGPAVVVGHLDSDHGPAVFWRLAELRPGDDVAVEHADGSAVRFVVTRIARFARSSFPSDEVYGATAAPELRLITCGGVFNRLTGQYADNVVVFAARA